MKSRGFTLLELLTVVAVIGLLVVVAVPNYQNYVRKAEFSSIWQAMGPILKKATLRAMKTRTCLTGTEKPVAGTRVEYKAKSTATAQGTICSVMARISSNESESAFTGHYILASFNVRLAGTHDIKCSTDILAQYYSPDLCTYKPDLATLW